jgi:hypothetical protein
MFQLQTFVSDLPSKGIVNDEYLRNLGWRHHLTLHAGQIVVVADVAEGRRSAAVKFALSEVMAELNMVLDDRG